MQDWVMDDIKKRLDRRLVEGQSAMSTTTGSNTPDQENFNLSKRSFIDFHLLAAVLIATVSFAAAFTMPRGYRNDGPDRGMATLAGRAAFKAFMILDTAEFVS